MSHLSLNILRPNVVLGLFLVLFVFSVIKWIPVTYAIKLEALVLAGLALYVIVLYAYRILILASLRLTHVELYIILYQFVPFYVAWRAYEVFGQPLLYGVLAQRHIWLSLGVLVIIDMLRKHRITYGDLEQVLLSVAWVSVLLYILMWLFIEPAAYAQYPLFVGGGDKNGYVFRFNSALILFGLFYYYYGYVKNKVSRNLVMMSPFLFFILVIDFKRSFIAALAVAIVFVTWRVFGLKRAIGYVLLPAVFGAVLIAGAGVYFSDSLDTAFDHFGQAVNVVLSGERGSDDSSNARIDEYNLVSAYIDDNLLLGSGDLSNHWRGGYTDQVGYFYPSDIGILGAVFVFGLLGVCFYYMQVLFLRGSQARAKVPMVFAMYSSVLVLILQSLIKGDLLFNPAGVMFFVAIYYHASRTYSAER